MRGLVRYGCFSLSLLIILLVGVTCAATWSRPYVRLEQDQSQIKLFMSHRGLNFHFLIASGSSPRLHQSPTLCKLILNFSSPLLRNEYLAIHPRSEHLLLPSPSQPACALIRSPVVIFRTGQT